MRPYNIFEAIHQQIGSGEPVYVPRGIESNATQHRPGSPEKLRHIAARVENGLELWHPEDCHTLDDASHRELVRELLTENRVSNDEQLIWVKVNAVIISETSHIITLRTPRTCRGFRDVRLQRGLIEGYWFGDIYSETPIPGRKVTLLCIPRWLARARNLVEES